MNAAEKLTQLIHDHTSSPFLFIGSGFSQRYLGTPTWESLLRQFCEKLSPFEYYYSSADSKLPRCAALISQDYSPFWWKSPEYADQRLKYQKHIISNSSPLKISVSDLLHSRFKIHKDPLLADELNALRALNVEGVITTNWDCLIESLFPGYKVYVGQQSIVKQCPQNIGEIFKIHGCCTDPNSLVLTEQDYNVFRDKQAYLAAKLITIFVEHPVVFIGYSISDPNILDLLRSILRGLGTEEVRCLQRNLIFVQRAKEGRPEGVHENTVVVDDTPLPIINLVTSDYISIYSALAQSKLKLPARILRFCKEQLYEIVSSKEPSDKLCLSNIDEIKDKSEIEFVVGLGVVNSQLAERGYQGVTIQDLFNNVITGNPSLDGQRILEQSLPNLDFGTNFIPVYKFLGQAGVAPGVIDVNATVNRLCSFGRDSYKTQGYAKQALREIAGHDFNWVVSNHPPEKAAVFIPHFPDDKIPIAELKAFLQLHLQRAFSDRYSTFYRKLLCLYDYLAFNGRDYTSKR